ncbi:Ribokinase-like protein [Zopfochytrium polystomum]|nr:Ribokinase-like protein [Zopfochytrium polystomum]
MASSTSIGGNGCAGVLVFGSLNVDEVFDVDSIVREGETIPSRGYARVPGGKGANQSVAAAGALVSSPPHAPPPHLPLPRVFHAGRVGADGVWLKDVLQSRGVDVDLVAVDPSVPTGRAIIQVSRSTRDNAIVLLPGANHAIPATSVADTLTRFVAATAASSAAATTTTTTATRFLVLQNEIANLPAILAAAATEHLSVVFNPAPCPPDLLATLPADLPVDIIVANQIEAAALLHSPAAVSDPAQPPPHAAPDGDSEEAAAMAARLLRAWPRRLKLAVVTLGAAGAVAARRRRRRRRRRSHHNRGGSDLRAVDTTGAGDTFVGFLVGALARALCGGGGWGGGDNDNDGDRLARLLRDRDALVDALRVAVAASGMACERHGAIPAIPVWADVERRMRGGQ